MGSCDRLCNEDDLDLLYLHTWDEVTFGLDDIMNCILRFYVTSDG